MKSRVFALLFVAFAVMGAFGGGKELTLAEAVQLALVNHPDIKRAAYQVSLAELQLASAQARTLFPSLSLSVFPSSGASPQANLSATMSFPFGTSNRLVGQVSFVPGPNWRISWTANFSLSVDLANPMAASDNLTSLARALDEARVSLEKTKANVIVSVIKGYLDVLSLGAKARQAEDTKRKAEENLKTVEDKVKAGLAGDLDLLQAKLSLIQAQLSHEQALASFQAQKTKFLRDYLGLDEDVELSPVSLDKEKLVSAAKKLLDSLDIEKAVESSSEVKAAKDKLEEARKTLERTRLSWLPTISLELGAGPEGLKLGWSVQFDLFSPDYAAQVRLNETQVALAELNLEVTRSTVRQKISDQRSALLSALQALDQLPLEEEQWALKELINRSKYEAGLLSESDWFDFQQQKASFMLDAQQRLANVLLAYLNLQATLGVPLEWEGWWK